MADYSTRGPLAFSNFRSTGSGTGLGIGDHRAIAYPSPFFDIAHTYLPYSVKALFRFCRYYYVTNPLIAAVVSKLSEYPVTEILYDTPDKEVRDQYQRLDQEVLDLRQFQVEANLDFYTYGNCYISIRFPFVKWLVCTHCGHEVRVRDAEYRFVGLKFRLTCPECGAVADALARDKFIRSINGIRLVRWNPESIDVEWNELTREPVYFFTIPTRTKNDIQLGKRDVIENIEQIFIDAVRLQKAVSFSRNGLIHLKRPTIAQQDMGLGMPLLLPVLKDVYYLQMMKKSQESVLAQHILPLRILFPQQGAPDGNPLLMTTLTRWQKMVEDEIVKWKRDPNHLPVLPLPIGHEMIGGDGRALLLFQEQNVLTDHIIAGLNVPAEFVRGGLSYAGSSVSMRILENAFIGQRTKMLRAIRTILRRIANFMDWRHVEVTFSPFKMADDLQRSSLHFQMVQANKLSTRSMLAAAGFDRDAEMEQILVEKQGERQLLEKDQLAQAVIQGKAQAIALTYSMEAQRKQELKALKAQQAPGTPEQPGAPNPAQIETTAQNILQALQSGEATIKEVQQAIQSGQIPPEVAQILLHAIGGSEESAKQTSKGIERGKAEAQSLGQGIPEGTTVYPENVQAKLPSDMTSAISGATTRGVDVRAVAKRIAAHLRKLPPAESQQELTRLQGQFPQLHELVVQTLQAQTGSQADPLSAAQAPLPEVRPPRREMPLL